MQAVNCNQTSKHNQKTSYALSNTQQHAEHTRTHTTTIPPHAPAGARTSASAAAHASPTIDDTSEASPPDASHSLAVVLA
jgi:hypothetical protein